MLVAAPLLAIFGRDFSVYFSFLYVSLSFVAEHRHNTLANLVRRSALFQILSIIAIIIATS